MSIVAPQSPTVTPGTVQFSAAEFNALFPNAFTTVPVVALAGNFSLACQLLNNTAASVVQDAPTRQYYLYLITAHITQLLQGVNGQPPAGTVGRINSASQGSVSVQMEWAAEVGNSEAFYIQTQYGAMVWQMMASYRTAYYVGPECSFSDISGFDAWPQ